MPDHDENDFARRIQFNRTWDMLSSRWKFYIVYLLAGGPVRFSALRRRCAAVSRVTLTSYLRQLEREGCVRRVVAGEPVRSVEYELTPLGRSVMPHVSALIDWGFEDDPR